MLIYHCFVTHHTTTQQENIDIKCAFQSYYMKKYILVHFRARTQCAALRQVALRPVKSCDVRRPQILRLTPKLYKILCPAHPKNTTVAAM
jgi:hypothetical protein